MQPINLDAEQKAVITLLDAEKSIQATMLEGLTEEYVGSDFAVEIFSRALTLYRHDKGIPSSVVMVNDPVLSDATRDHLSKIQTKPIQNQEDILGLIKVLNQHRKIRIITNGLREVLMQIKNSTDETLDAPLTKIEQILMAVKSEQQQIELIVAGAGDSSHADAIVDSIIAGDKDTAPIKTGFKLFDEKAGGFRRSNLVIIAGPSRGCKSLMRTQILKNMYQQEHLNTFIVSLEMSKQEEMMRLLSNISQVPLSNITNNKLSVQENVQIRKSWEVFKDVGKEHGNVFKIHVPQEGTTATSIIQWLKPHKPDVIVVDYIGLIEGKSKEQQWESLGNIAKEFKQAAQAMNACIILLAQFDSDNNRIKYSRGIFEHANIVWGWHYGAEEESTGIVEILQTAPIGKNRNTRPFNFKLLFQLDTMTITDFNGPNAISEVYTPKDQAKPKGNYQSSQNSPRSESKAVSYTPPRTPMIPKRSSVGDL